jgi:hypothetical protein
MARLNLGRGDAKLNQPWIGRDQSVNQTDGHGECRGLLAHERLDNALAVGGRGRDTRWMARSRYGCRAHVRSRPVRPMCRLLRPAKQRPLSWVGGAPG